MGQYTQCLFTAFSQHVTTFTSIHSEVTKVRRRIESFHTRFKVCKANLVASYKLFKSTFHRQVSNELISTYITCVTICNILKWTQSFVRNIGIVLFQLIACQDCETVAITTSKWWASCST